MTELTPVPAGHFAAADFLKACKPDDLVYFLLNVGDGDAQVLLLPEDASGSRQAIVVDVAKAKKTLALFDALFSTGPKPLLTERPDLIALLVATHPHEDHVAGIPKLLEKHPVEEIWEPGYYYAGPGFFEMMKAIERSDLRHLQPTSGLVRYIGPVKLTALSPGIGLRNRFDSYGVDTNNSSIAMKVEYPMNRYIQRNGDRSAVKLPKPVRLILGADSQTLSWAQVQIDFPQLGPDTSAVATALRKANGVEPLKADVFKISHHGSKHGISLELLELIEPRLSLVSSDLTGSNYGFPHQVALEQIREALEATTTSGAKHSPDWELGLHYTCGTDSEKAELGSIALVLPKSGRGRSIWRFGDSPAEAVDLTKARRFT
jgi:beta-lactamase superfamily II metal-dependent hydrolase